MGVDAQAMKPEIENLRDRIRDAEELDERDSEALLKFSQELALRQAEYSDHRHEKLLRHCVLMAEGAGPLAEVLESEERTKSVVGWIHATYENEETNRDYRVALRRFGKVMADANGWVPESVDLNDQGIPRTVSWVNSTTSSTYDPAPDPAKMLTWEDDVEPMIQEAKNERDAAAIAMQMDAGFRGGEFANLTVGSVTETDYGWKVTVQGKQGQRSVTLVPSGPYVERWMRAHPARDDPDAPLWSHLNKPEAVSRQLLYKMFREPAKRAGVDKPVTPTNFRKSSASWVASQGMNQAHIEDRYGWVRGSKVASRYISVFSEDADREYRKLHGADVEEEEPEDRTPVQCHNCENETPRSKDLCVWCGRALEPGVAEVAMEMEEVLVDAIADAENEEEREAYKETWREVRDNPERRAEMVDDLASKFAD